MKNPDKLNITYAKITFDDTRYNPKPINPIISTPWAIKNGFLLKFNFLVTTKLNRVPIIPPTVSAYIMNSGLNWVLPACSVTTLGNDTNGITYKNKNPPNPSENT